MTKAAQGEGGPERLGGLPAEQARTLARLSIEGAQVAAERMGFRTDDAAIKARAWRVFNAVIAMAMAEQGDSSAAPASSPHTARAA